MLLHLWNLENLPYFYTFLTQFLFSGGQHWVDKSKGLEHNITIANTYRYVVIIDAGSTGSRVHAFKFRVPYTVIGPMIDLVDNFYVGTTPGLSDYIDDPVQGAQSIVNLINKADFFIPFEERHRTPIVVRPTAGLRLLPTENAATILDHVEDAISRLGYHTDEDSVKIMDGADEGIFNWIAVNILARYSFARRDIKSKEFLAALDMGGASMQMTFKVDEDHLSSYPKKDIFSIGTDDPVKVYSHSYFRGKNSARRGILNLEHESFLPRRTGKMFKTDCLDPAVQNLTWSFMGQQYILSGARRKSPRSNEIFRRCYYLVKKYLLKVKGFMPQPPPGSRVAAVSYFYHAARDAGIVDKDGGVVSISQYRDAAMRACSETNLTQPWLCINLVYVLTVLEYGFNMNDKDNLFLFETAEGVDVTWTVGLAYMTILNKMSQQEKPYTRNHLALSLPLSPSECLRYDKKRKISFLPIVCAYRAFRDEK